MRDCPRSVEREPTERGGADRDTTDDEGHDGSSVEPATELVGRELEIGYPNADGPVVACDTIVVPAGEITALVGPNGSGKSTLLRTLSNQHVPDSGRVLLNGERIQSLDPKRLARRLGLLSQRDESSATISVEDLAHHGRYPHRGFFDAVTEEDRRAVDRALDLAGVDHLRDRSLESLSGGQRQLAWIAMVLAQETDVLLLDEPTTYLDLHHQLRVLDVVRTLNREEQVTVGVVLHDIGQAARYADNLVALCDGSVYDWGPPADVVTEDLLADVFRVEASVDATSPTGPHVTAHEPIDGDGGTG